jgi:hypothetical protein
MNAYGTVGKLYKDTIQATDQDSNTILHFSIINGPAGIDSITGIISWMPATTGNFSITARVKDNSNAFANITWTISVDNAITSGLIAFYPLNGNANDESGNGRNGTVSGAVLASDMSGNADKAYLFNGNDDYIALPNGIDAGNSFTITAWIFPNDTVGSTPDDSRVIFRHRAEYRDINMEYGKFAGIDGKIMFRIYATGWYVLCSTKSLSLNDWHFVAISYNGTTKKVIIDGIIDTSIIWGQSVSWTTGEYCNEIGRNYYDGPLSANRSFPGKIDDIRIYNRELSASELGRLYQQGAW